MSQQINLFNPLFLKQEKLFSLKTMAQALGAIALGLAALYGFALYETRAGEIAALQYRMQVAAQRAEFVSMAQRLSPQGRSKVLETEVARLDAEAKARQATLDALATGQLGNVEGFSEYFAAFGRRATAGVWLTGIEIGEAGAELKVRGRVLEPELVPSYLRALGTEPMMQGRTVVELRLAAKIAATLPAETATRAGPREYVEFSFSAPRAAAVQAPLPAPPAAIPAPKRGAS